MFDVDSRLLLAFKSFYSWSDVLLCPDRPN